MPGNSRLPGARRSRRLRMLIGVVLALFLGAMLPSVPASAATSICSNQTGTNSGYYYQMWSSGQGSACISLNSGNSYSSSWSGIGDFVAGVGWNPGDKSTKSFTGSLNANGGTSLVSLYGWSTNPLVEYYVMENYVGSPPTSGQYMGQVSSDGGTFNIYEHQQVNQPCITGNNCTFEQYLAIRTSPVSSGTITMSNYINAWSSHGMNLGTLNYQILATEAWGGGSGSSNVSVSSGGGRWRRRWRRRWRWRWRWRRRLHRDAVGRHARQQLVQPQRRRHRLQQLDRDDEHGLARRRLQHVERQRHLAQPIRDGRQTERERQQLRRDHQSKRPMDMAISVL